MVEDASECFIILQQIKTKIISFFIKDKLPEGATIAPLIIASDPTWTMDNVLDLATHFYVNPYINVDTFTSYNL